MTLDDIKDKIENAESIVIFTHEKPDGDAIGSSLAFYIAMKKLEKNVDVIIPHFPTALSQLAPRPTSVTSACNHHHFVGLLQPRMLMG